MCEKYRLGHAEVAGTDRTVSKLVGGLTRLGLVGQPY